MDADSYKIIETDLEGKGVSAQSNPMELPEAEAKAVFDQLVKEVVVPRFNWVLDALEVALDLKVDKERKTGSETEYKVLSDNNYSDLEKAKLSGVADNANNYIHPTTHDASIIVESTAKRFVSDADKTKWNEVINKVDKVVGKQLSTNDYTDLEKTKLAGVTDNANNYVHPATHDASIIVESTAKRFVSDAEKVKWDEIVNKVDKVAGKQLSSEDYTSEEKAKLASLVDISDIVDITEPINAGELLLIANTALATANELGKGITITIAPYNSTQKNNAKIVLNGDYNDAEIINDAITQLTNGGKILLLDGTISLHQPIRPKPNIILEGSGDATVFKLMADIDAIENIEVLFNCILRDFLIDGNKVDNPYTNGGNALHLFMTHSTVERVKTQNIKKSALLLNWDNNVSDSMGYLNKILHCEFEDSEDEAVKWGWRTTDSWFCYNNVGSTKANLRIEGGSCRFIGNHLDGSPEYNIYMGGGCEVVSFSQNVIENAQKHAVFLEKPGYATSYKSVSFNDNLIRGCSRSSSGMYDLINMSGYDASHKNELVQITNNRMINSNAEKPRFYVNADYTDGMVVSGNVFSGYNESTPINITENCDYSVISNNSLIGENFELVNSFMTDESTGKKYIFGVDVNGLYYKEVL